MAGIVAALTSNPIDLAKSRLMSMKPDANGVMPYTGTFDCIYKTAGLLQGPHSLVSPFRAS